MCFVIRFCQFVFFIPLSGALFFQRKTDASQPLSLFFREWTACGVLSVYLTADIRDPSPQRNAIFCHVLCCNVQISVCFVIRFCSFKIEFPLLAVSVLDHPKLRKLLLLFAGQYLIQPFRLYFCPQIANPPPQFKTISRLIFRFDVKIAVCVIIIL